MTKRNIILIILFVILAAAGVFYLITESAPRIVTFGTAQKLSSAGFLAQIIKIYEIDKKHGLDIIFDYNEPGLTMTKLLNRELETGILAPISAAKANLEGKKIRIFGPTLWNANSLAVPSGSPYQTLEELKGKKFGILPQITAAYTNMALIALEKGWRLEGDFQLIIGGIDDQIKFLKNRDIDFAIVYEPQTSKLIAAGEIIEIITLDELWEQITGERFAFIDIAAYDDWLISNKKEAKKLVETFLEATKLINQNPDLIEKHKDLLGLQTSEETSHAKQRMPSFYPTEWTQASVDNINNLIRRAANAGLINKMPDEPIALVLD